MTTASAVKLEHEVPNAAGLQRCRQLFDDIGASSAWQSIQDTFAHMEMAEAAIERMERRFPDRKDAINRCFIHLRWQSAVTVTDVVFRHHVDELLQRVVDNEPLAPGTKAEVLVVLHAGSLVAPPGAQCTALFVELFEELYGDALGEFDCRIQEPWVGASDELLSELRRKLKADRQLTK